MISIIIPTYNEASQISFTIERLKALSITDDFEVIVADGGSVDETVALAKRSGVKTLRCKKKGRAAQMNAGAFEAQGDILYFLHADTTPPRGFDQMIVRALANGYQAGCFSLSFDHEHWFLKANCWFTRFDINSFRFGDQSLFVTKNVFDAIGGFCEDHLVMEDQQIIGRIRRLGRFVVIKKPVSTSARKYLENGIYKTQGVFFIIYMLYKLGFSQRQLVLTYKKLISQKKL